MVSDDLYQFLPLAGKLVFKLLVWERKTVARSSHRCVLCILVFPEENWADFELLGGMASSGSTTSNSSISTSSGSTMRRQATPSGVSLAKKRRAAAAAKSTKVSCSRV